MSSKILANHTADEIVIWLSQQKPDDVVPVGLDLSDLDLTAAECKATYEEIKEYVWKEFGLKVSSLYVSQIIRRYGLDLGQNYNLSKKEVAKTHQRPPEKEAAIRAALEYFKIL